MPFYLSAKFQKSKEKGESASFPPPPTQIRSPQITSDSVSVNESEQSKQAEGTDGKVDEKKDDSKHSEGSSSPPRAPKRFSVKLNLNGIEKGTPVHGIPSSVSLHVHLLTVCRPVRHS